MSRRAARGTRRALLVLGLLALAALAWCGWQVAQTYRDLAAARQDAAALQDAVSRRDHAGARVALDALVRQTGSAAERTSARTWDVLVRLPVLGDDAQGVRTTSEVLSDLSRDGLAPVVDSLPDLDALTPRGGRLALDAVARLQAPVQRSAAAFATADARLAAEDPSGYDPRWRSQFRDLRQQVAAADEALRAAARAVRVLPSMLGADGPRRYLVIVQNNAEVRATGGLPGAVVVVEAVDGQVSLAGQLAAASLPEADAPVLPLTAEEQQVYGAQMGTWFLDANFTPDFPRAAELWRARYEQVAAPVDGVVAVDPVTLGYVLEATGPVTAGGLELTAENAASTLLNTVYLQIADPFAQDRVFQDVAEAVFTRVTTGMAAPDVLLARGAAERRVLVHSFHAPEQRVLDGTVVAGALPTGQAGDPHVGVYLNDNTGSKMSYFLRTAVDARASRCVRDIQTVRATARFRSDAPSAPPLPDSVTGGGLYGFPPGDQLVAVRLYGPVGGTVDGVELDGEPLEPVQAATHEGRPVVTAFVYLKPGDGVELTWDSTTGPGQTGDVHVDVTPGVSGSSDSVVPSAC